MPKKHPSYRQRKGYTQALVTLTDSLTKQRRDYWLGSVVHGALELWYCQPVDMPTVTRLSPPGPLHSSR